MFSFFFNNIFQCLNYFMHQNWCTLFYKAYIPDLTRGITKAMTLDLSSLHTLNTILVVSSFLIFLCLKTISFTSISMSVDGIPLLAFRTLCTIYFSSWYPLIEKQPEKRKTRFHHWGFFPDEPQHLLFYFDILLLHISYSILSWF